MSETKQARKPSFTNRLCLHLLEKFPDKDELDKTEIINEIKAFSKTIAKEIESENNKPVEVFPYGRYKNKRITDIAKIDLDYCKWMLRQSSLRPNLKAALDAVVNQKKDPEKLNPSEENSTPMVITTEEKN
jgi:hypothetical protein